MKKFRKLKHKSGRSAPLPTTPVNFHLEIDDYKIIKLNKTKELEVRRFIRELTGAPTHCKIFDTVNSNWCYDITPYKFPTFLGSPPTWKMPDYTNVPPPKWYRSKSGIRTHTKWPEPTYVASTLRIEVGIDMLNSFKVLMTSKKSKKAYKMQLGTRIINLPNLAVGRLILKHHPLKEECKIIT